MKIILNEIEFFYTVQYSKRTKITMELSPEGNITIKAPSKTSNEEIEFFLKQNSKQLICIHRRLERKVTVASQKKYEEQENFLYLGHAIPLKTILVNMSTLSKNIETSWEVHNIDQESLQLLLKKFYMKHTKDIIIKRVKHFEHIIKVQSKSVTITSSPGTWGTCNNKKELTFNYRLSMAPEPVIDYVVIHELCHILHLNHDRSFWRKVGTYDENYKQHQEYLSSFGAYMTI